MVVKCFIIYLFPFYVSILMFYRPMVARNIPYCYWLVIIQSISSYSVDCIYSTDTNLAKVFYYVFILHNREYAYAKCRQGNHVHKPRNDRCDRKRSAGLQKDE